MADMSIDSLTQTAKEEDRFRPTALLSYCRQILFTRLMSTTAREAKLFTCSKLLMLTAFAPCASHVAFPSFQI